MQVFRKVESFLLRAEIILLTVVLGNFVAYNCLQFELACLQSELFYLQLELSLACNGKVPPISA